MSTKALINPKHLVDELHPHRAVEDIGVNSKQIEETQVKDIPIKSREPKAAKPMAEVDTPETKIKA